MTLKTRLGGVSVLVLAALGGGLGPVAPARAQTAIAVDQEAGFETGTTVSASDGTFTISGGEASGANLFHSFAEFNLASGDIAQWVRGQADAAAIEHVINRVRSASPSMIEGTIRMSDMPNADFWFINPAGVVFGAGAALDVPGAAHFATAQEIALGGGERFSTVHPDGSTFSSAPPQAFGFLGGSADFLLEDGFSLADPAAAPARLSLVGADIAVEGGHVFARTALDLIALGDAALGDIPLARPDGSERAAPVGTGTIVFASPTGEPARLDLPGGQDLSASASTIRASNFVIASGSGAGGTLLFNADTLSLDTSRIESIALSEGESADIRINAGRVDFATTEPPMFLPPQAIFSSTQSGAAGALIAINAQTIRASQAGIVAETTGGGSGGNISIIASERFELADTSQIETLTGNRGEGGSITITSPEAVVRGGSLVRSSIFDGATGTSGSISFSGGSLLVDGAFIISNAPPGAEFLTVAINIDLTGDLMMTGGGEISTSTVNERDAGAIEIAAENVTLSGSALLSDTSFAGDGGIISVEAGQSFTATNNSLISSSTFGAGDALGVFIAAPRIAIKETRIESQSFPSATGAAGLVLMAGSQSMRLGPGAVITVQTVNENNAGVVFLRAGSLEIQNAEISSTTTGAGLAGDILIRANNAAITGVAMISSEAAEGSTGTAGDLLLEIESDLLIEQSTLSASTAGARPAGNITIEADRLTINEGTVRSASLFGAGGRAGNIAIDVDVFDARFASIASFTASSAPGGRISIAARDFAMEGGRIDSASDAITDGGDAGGVFIRADNAVLNNFARIDSEAASGAGGEVRLAIAQTFDISDGAVVGASTLGEGQAGSVEVEAGTLLMSGGNITSFTRGSGNAGDVLVTAKDFVMTGGRIDSASDFDSPDVGDAGVVLIAARQASLSGDARIDSTGLVGNAGDVALMVENSLSIADTATISAQTNGSGEAGIVNVSAGLLAMSGGMITSRSLGSGVAGTVIVTLEDLQMTGGEIGSSAGGSGNAGNVLVVTERASLAGSARIESETLEGSSGNAGTVTLQAMDEIRLTDGAVISTTVEGGELAGDITLSAAIVSLDNRSLVVSEAAGTGNAGAIAVLAERLSVANGSAISTNSENGPAGGIILEFPDDGELRLDGLEPGVITTSSGANTGGVIVISNPALILSTGGSILALGEQGGANVQITSQFFIRSSDRLNEVSVDGSLVLDSQVGEQIAATPPVDLGFLDASGILSGQCAPARAGEGQSRFSSRITGPYVLPPAPEPITIGAPQTMRPPDRAPALASLAVCR